MITADSDVAVRAATSSRRVRRFVRLRSVASTGSAIWASKDLTNVSFDDSHRPATLNIAFSPDVFGCTSRAGSASEGRVGLA
jgi:hypothetical protein